jgi:hypothetical protein
VSFKSLSIENTNVGCKSLFVYIAIHIAQLAWRLLFVTFRGICNVRGQGHCSIVFDVGGIVDHHSMS